MKNQLFATSQIGGRFRLTEFAFHELARGLALFFGGFALFNVAAGFRAANLNANLWWLDLRWLPPAVPNALVTATALLLLAFAIRPPRSTWRCWLTIGCAGLLGVVSLVNAARFFILLAQETIHTGMPVPLSLFVAAAMALIVAANLRPWWLTRQKSHAASVLAVSLVCLAGFPLAQMLCFGKTDYRRPADVAVVLGARVYADGRPSDALADRVRTACQLYHQHLVAKLICSGGPGDGAVHETESMKRLAVRLGVKPQDILVDEEGWNTLATVKNTEALFRQLHARRVLVVSHFYHLPRIKLSYQRDGLDVYTVPAKESYLLRQLPYNVAREIAALWVYYLRPCFQPV